MSICSCTHNSMHHSYATGCVMCNCELRPDQVDSLNSNADQIIEAFWAVKNAKDEAQRQQDEILSRRRRKE